MRIRLWLFSCLLVFWPGVAHAQWAWYEWLQELSGPGGFHVVGFGVRTLCANGNTWTSIEWKNCFFRPLDPLPLRVFIETRIAVGTTGNAERFQDVPGDTRSVRITMLQVVPYFRVRPRLDVGVGAGGTRFSGRGFDAFWRPSFPASAVVRLLRARGIDLKFRAEGTYFPKAFTGADFGHPEISYRTDGEVVPSFAIIVDFSGT